MGFIVITGANGRMSQMLQEICLEQKQAFKLYSPNAQKDLATSSFSQSKGVIDFSLPSAQEEISQKICEAKVPWVCGTTGWNSSKSVEQIFSEAAKYVPVVWDSNFSLGIELLSQMSELLARNLDTQLSITDLHHVHKKDAPSGTALKLGKRIQQANSGTPVTYKSIREGEIPGEHRVLASFKDETIELIHRAHSRRPFAEGAIRALNWAQGKKPGFYSMKDVLEKG